jgi:hypothetical protein
MPDFIRHTKLIPLLFGMILISSFFLTLSCYFILLLYLATFFTSKKVAKEGGSCSQALPPMDGRYLKNAGAVFYRLLCALRQKRRCGTRRQKTLLKQSSLNPFLTPVLDCSKARACANRNKVSLN